MKNLFLVLIAALTLSMTSVVSYASPAPAQTPAVQCLTLPSVTPEDVKKYLTMVVAQTRFLEGFGGGPAFSAIVPNDVQVLGAHAIDGLQAYANGQAKCVQDTQEQLKALLVCVQGELTVIDAGHALPTYFNWVKNALGPEATADYAKAMIKVTKSLESAVK